MITQMEKPICSLCADARPGAQSLTKNLPQRYVEGTFDELVGYMLDQNEDELNPSYNEDERRLAGRIRSWAESHNNNPEESNVNLMYFNEDDSLSEPLDLEAKVSDYLPSMINRRRQVMDDGVNEYDEVKLVYNYHPGGGQ
jgi:hypothetical protein